MSLPLQGRRCLVTGGGTGIGAGIAHVLAAQGARVAVLGRRTAPLAAIVRSLGGPKAGMMAVAGDVTKPKSMARGCAAVRKAFGGLDVVVAMPPDVSLRHALTVLAVLGLIVPVDVETAGVSPTALARLIIDGEAGTAGVVDEGQRLARRVAQELGRFFEAQRWGEPDRAPPRRRGRPVPAV